MFLAHPPPIEHHYTLPAEPTEHTLLFVTRHHQTPCSANDPHLMIDYGKTQTLQGGLSNEEGYNELTPQSRELANEAPKKMRSQLKDILNNDSALMGLCPTVVTSTLSRCVQTALPLAKALAMGGCLHDLTDSTSNSQYQICGNTLYQADNTISLSANSIRVPIKQGLIEIKGVTADLNRIWISQNPIRIEIKDAQIDEALFSIIVKPLDLAIIDVVINGMSLSLNPDWREAIHGWADGKITASQRNALVKTFDKKIKELAQEFFFDQPINPNVQTLFNPLNIVVNSEWKGPRAESIQEVIDRVFKASRTTAQRHANSLVLVVSSTGILQSFMTSEKRRQDADTQEFPLYYFGQFLLGSQGCLIKVNSNGVITYNGSIDGTSH
jgi:broad specificity phosphatase PhoE